MAGRELLEPRRSVPRAPAARRDLREAIDVFLTLLGSEVYLNLTEARGWSVDRYVSWVTDTLRALFLREADQDRQHPMP